MEDQEFDVNALNAALNGELPPTTTPEPEDAEIADPADDVNDDDVDEEEDEPEVLAEHVIPQESKSRKEARLQKLANERATEREQRLLAEQRAQLLEQQLQDLRTSQHKPAPVEEENLDPLEKWQRDANRTLMQVQMRQADIEDRSKFVEQVSKNPAEAAYMERVEAHLATARQKGANPPREHVLTYLMGVDARAKMAQAPAMKKEAAARVKAATGKPLGTKSNVAPTKTDSTEYDRLKGIQL